MGFFDLNPTIFELIAIILSGISLTLSGVIYFWKRARLSFRLSTCMSYKDRTRFYIEVTNNGDDNTTISDIGRCFVDGKSVGCKVIAEKRSNTIFTTGQDALTKTKLLDFGLPKKIGGHEIKILILDFLQSFSCEKRKYSVMFRHSTGEQVFTFDFPQDS